jgi:hypothetical protein
LCTRIRTEKLFYHFGITSVRQIRDMSLRL